MPDEVICEMDELIDQPEHELVELEDEVDDIELDFLRCLHENEFITA